MGKKSAVLLLFISDFKEANTEKLYKVADSEKTYPGVQTNDAPVRYLCDCAAEKGNPIQKVLYIASYYVLKNEKQMGKAVENLRTILKDAAKQYKSELPELVEIPYDISEQGEKLDKQKAQTSICTHLMEELGKLSNGSQEGEGCEVYIDYTGGLRDIAFLMTSVIKYLEFTGSSCGKIVYSEIGDGKIYSLDHIYGLYQLINGVREFANSGKAMELVRYFEKEGPEKRVIESMLDFSDAISLCDSNRIQKSMELLDKSIIAFNELNHNDFNAVMMAALLSYVREKLFLDEKGKVSYERLIEWCRGNRYIQQAVTLYVEKIPQELFDTEGMDAAFARWEIKYQTSFNILEQLKEKNPKEAFYTEFFRAFSNEGRNTEDNELTEESECLKNFCQELKKIVAKEETCRKKTAVLIKINNRKKEAASSVLPGSERLVPGLERLGKLIDDHFDKCGKKNKELVINGMEQRQNTMESFISTVINEPCIRMNLLTGLIYTSKTQRQEKSVYIQKTEALDKLKSLSEDEESQALRNVLGYYLALKITRNQVNHAEEVIKQKEDEIKAMDYLKREGFISNKEPGTASEKLEAISSLIEKGLEANRQLKEFIT